MTNSIIIPIPLGLTAAALTFLEYILSTISALSIHASLHGFLLFSLHRQNHMKLSLQSIQRRSLFKSILSSFLSLLLLASVALVESNLQSGYYVQPNLKDSPRCVSMYGKYAPARMRTMFPPYRTVIEPWVHYVLNSLQCPHGIASMGVPSPSGFNGQERLLGAPKCDTIMVNATDISVQLNSFILYALYYKVNYRYSGSYSIFPCSPDNLGNDSTRGASNEGPCVEKGISNRFYDFSKYLNSIQVHGQNLSLGIHERLCELHAPSEDEVLAKSTLDDCIDWKNQVNVTCIRDKASTDKIHTVSIKNVTGVFVEKDVGAQAYVCFNAKVKVDYLIVPGNSIAMFKTDLKSLIAIGVRVEKGECMRTVAGLGQMALWHGMEEGWWGGEMSHVSIRERYLAYLLALGGLFPLNEISGEESPKDRDGKCEVYEVKEGTDLELDWRVALLITAFVVAVISMIAGGTFRMWFGGSWRVGSLEWALGRTLGEGGRGLIEVVENEEESKKGDGKSKALEYRMEKLERERQDSEDQRDIGLPQDTTRGLNP